MNPIKRLTIEMFESEHRDIKLRAIERGITVKKWVLEALADKIKKEDKYLPLKEKI